MKKIVVANLKMNLKENDISNYVKTINSSNLDKINLYISPSFLYLKEFVSEKYHLTAQDVSIYKEGEYTGEVSAKQLKSLSIDSVIIGHSERRNLFNENFEIINEKIKRALENNLKVILCIGEKKEKSNEENLKDILKELKLDFKDIKNLKNIIIAYEPEYAIGNKCIDLNKIDYIYKNIKSKYNLKVIYGGSVNSENIDKICNITDGVIIGKMSLNVLNFINIIKKIQ